MFSQSWNRFAHATPGRRFQERYRRMQRSDAGALKRCGCVAGGVLLCLVGIFFMVVPGPGIPILAFGLALIAQCSRTLARALDRTEVRLRIRWKRWRERR